MLIFTICIYVLTQFSRDKLTIMALEI
jgi:hypothetical protein